MIPRKHHIRSFLAITMEVCQIQMILTLIPLQNEHDGWGYAQNILFVFWAEMTPRKHHFWSFLAITMEVCQIQMILTLIPLQNQHVGMGYAQNIQILFWAEHIAQNPSLFVVFGFNNCSVSNPNDFNTHTSSKSICWDGICAKHTNFILSWTYCSKPFIICRFGFNNCSVSNPNDFNTHTSSK